MSEHRTGKLHLAAIHLYSEITNARETINKDEASRLQYSSSGQSLSSIHTGDVGHQIQHSTTVSPFIVVPAHQLDEIGIQRDTGLDIEDG
jgi:hypothetical protein